MRDLYAASLAQDDGDFQASELPMLLAHAEAITIAPRSHPMTESTPAITKKIRELVRLELDQLARIRDEIRLKVHLGSMEGRSTWAVLEKRFEQLEVRFGHEGDHIVGRTRLIAAEVQAAFLDFKKTLTSERPTDPALPHSR